MLEVVSNEKLDEWVSRSYATACSHGFHDVSLSKKHFLSLVLSEVGELVDADRSNRRADDYAFDIAIKFTVSDSFFKSCYEDYIKGSVEEELADVCIRLFDYCGVFGIELDVTYDEEMRLRWKELFGEQSLCENCYELCNLVCDIDEGDDGEGIGCVLSFVFCMCYWMDICIDRHIDLKMRYNILRSRMHGKKY